MELTKSDRRTFDLLVSRWCAGDISVDEASQLSELLARDETLIAEFAESIQLNSMLLQIKRGLSAATIDEILEPPAADTANDTDTAAKVDTVNEMEWLVPTLIEQAASRNRAASKWRNGLVMFAVILMCVAAVYRLASDRDGDPSRNPNIASPATAVDTPLRQQSGRIDEPAYAAKVIRRIDCEFDSDRWELIPSSLFVEGQSVRVSRGVVVLEFVTGATVSLEGPAELEIVSANSGFLNEGKLTAVVPPSAVGFTIQTPTSHVIDHGTEFGVQVLANGSSETHVFEGEVELQFDGNAETKRLTGTMATRSEMNRSFHSIRSQPDKFIRVRDIVSTTPTVVGDIASQWDEVVPKLWFDANQGVQLDAEKRVTAWRNVALPSRELDAWQVNAEQRPRFVAADESLDENANQDRAGPKQYAAVQFAGSEYFVTPPLSIGSEITALVVMQMADAEHRRGRGQILTIGGFPNLVLDHNAHGELRSRVYSYRPKRHGILKADDPLLSDQIYVVGYRYSVAEDRFELYRNGELMGTASHTSAIKPAAQLAIGGNRIKQSDFYSGAIREIVIFDQLLLPQDFQQATDHLMEKHGIVAAEVLAKEEVPAKNGAK
ncbi:LamG-like jellyroll fold domain-containing protein [Novipirellula rosea]|uniref:FecR protein n=1 Tax=Novipirellula rosea TaxID=1031540 RepID=A0ABP8M6P2_9BACT